MFNYQMLSWRTEERDGALHLIELPVASFIRCVLTVFFIPVFGNSVYKISCKTPDSYIESLMILFFAFLSST